MRLQVREAPRLRELVLALRQFRKRSLTLVALAGTIVRGSACLLLGKDPTWLTTAVTSAWTQSGRDPGRMALSCLIQPRYFKLARRCSSSSYSSLFCCW